MAGEEIRLVGEKAKENKEKKEEKATVRSAPDGSDNNTDSAIKLLMWSY